jgi:hypothetical protein
MNLGYALGGLVMLAWEVALTRWIVAELAKQGRPTRQAWRRVPLSPITWAAVICLVWSVSAAAAGVLMGVILVLAFVFVLVLLARGVRGLPQFARELRRMGDPEAWRGRGGSQSEP